MIVSILLCSLLVAGCSAADGKGGELPTPIPAVAPGEDSPPAAWIVVDGRYVPATYGSFCHKTVCVDKGAPQMRQDLSTTSLPGGDRVLLVIGSGRIEDYRVTVQKWTGLSDHISDRSTRELKGQGEPRGDFFVSALEPIGNSGEQLLVVEVTYPEGNATYLWRLNPAK